MKEEGVHEVVAGLVTADDPAVLLSAPAAITRRLMERCADVIRVVVNGQHTAPEFAEIALEGIGGTGQVPRTSYADSRPPAPSGTDWRGAEAALNASRKQPRSVALRATASLRRISVRACSRVEVEQRTEGQPGSKTDG